MGPLFHRLPPIPSRSLPLVLRGRGPSPLSVTAPQAPEGSCHAPPPQSFPFTGQRRPRVSFSRPSHRSAPGSSTPSPAPLCALPGVSASFLPRDGQSRTRDSPKRGLPRAATDRPPRFSRPRYCPPSPDLGSLGTSARSPAVRGLPPPPAPLPTGNPPSFPRAPPPQSRPSPPRGGVPGRGFPGGTFALLFPPVSPLAPGHLPSNNDDMAIRFSYWWSVANHQLALGSCVVSHPECLFLRLRLQESGGGVRIAAGMAPRSLSLSLLVLVALRESCLGASSHSLKYFSTSILDPKEGLPYFVCVGYVDGQIFAHYDSNSRKVQPRVSWVEKVGKEDPQYWDRSSQILRGNEEAARVNLETARTRYNLSEVGLHTWQVMYVCELQGDGSKRGFAQYGYDGRTFITFDKETLTWVAPSPQAQITQREWDAIPEKNQYIKSYLEKICIEWLMKFLSYEEETLLRTEPPVVTMSSRTEVEDGMETHVCRLDGFYPREIDASWRRDGEVWLQDTLHGSVAPNADGTHHYWLSIRIDPKERGRYRCHVEHDSLQEPLDVALKESNLGLIIGCVVAGLVLVCVIGGIWFFKRHQEGYRAASSG